MKAVGVILILVGAVLGYVQSRERARFSLDLCRALLRDLAVLKCEVCISRRPIPEILSERFGEGIAKECFWLPLRERLSACGRGRSGGLSQCWRETVCTLPAAPALFLEPLGPLLAGGGDVLAKAIDEVREELIRAVHAEAGKLAERERISAAMHFGGAFFVILILL